ncbi:MAG TPA: hypothetical protein VF916_01530, partial [Ktedonobacterales bacterium]
MDTFLVRTLLVPAMVVLLGRWTWWPSPLFTQAASLQRRNEPVNTTVAALGDPTPVAASPEQV